MSERQGKRRASPPAPAGAVPAAASDVYARLSAPFDVTFTDFRGGVELTYVTGEQVTSRLCEVLGVQGWSFRVVEHGINVEADEIWVLGELTAEIAGQTVTRQQFGSQKLKRARSSGAPLDIGFDLKGAATDALKKCASLIGVGLYLSRKESLPAPAPAAGPRLSAVTPGEADAPVCDECGATLKETRFKDGTTWGPTQLAGYGRRKHGRVLCMDHYRAANEARKAAVVAHLSA